MVYLPVLPSHRLKLLQGPEHSLRQRMAQRRRKPQGISPTSRKIRLPSPVFAMTKLVLSPAVGLNWTELGCKTPGRSADSTAMSGSDNDSNE